MELRMLMEMKLVLVSQFVCWGSGKECSDSPSPARGDYRCKAAVSTLLMGL